MSVGETYEVRVSGADEGLAIVERLAGRVGALARWVATWTTPERAAALASRSARVQVMSLDYVEFQAVSISCPTADEIRDFIGHADTHALAVHFGPIRYVGDEGPDSPWISYVDHEGRRRVDAKVDAIELARDAVPLTTMAARPGESDFCFEPQSAEGWALHLSVVRDHMPVEQLVKWLANAAEVSNIALLLE